MITNPIVQHIFNYFGIPSKMENIGILSDKNKINKILSIELEDGEILQRSLWGVEGTIAGSNITVLTANIGSENVLEYALVFQLDKLSTYCLKLECYPDGNNRAFVSHSDVGWVELTDLLLAKLLVGIEQLNETFISFKPLSNYQHLYEQLISFLNYEESIQNNK